MSLCQLIMINFYFFFYFKIDRSILQLMIIFVIFYILNEIIIKKKKIDTEATDNFINYNINILKGE